MGGGASKSWGKIKFPQGGASATFYMLFGDNQYTWYHTNTFCCNLFDVELYFEIDWLDYINGLR